MRLTFDANLGLITSESDEFHYSFCFDYNNSLKLKIIFVDSIIASYENGNIMIKEMQKKRHS